MKNRKTNQEAQKKHKFNIIDGLVLALVLTIVAGIIIYFNPFKWDQLEVDNTSQETVICVVELRDIESFESASIKKGDDVVFVTKGFDVGRIIKVNRTQSSKWELGENGDEMVLINDKSKETVYITIELDCTYIDGQGYFIHNQQLLVGNDIELRLPHFNEIGRCISIQSKE
mgnify:CR=1 FL=1